MQKESQQHNDNNKRRLLSKNMYLSLYCKGSKRVIQGLRVRGSWRPNITAIYWPPLLWPSALCLSRSPDAQPEAQQPSSLLGDGFLYCILSATSLDPNSIGGPEGPFGLVWLSLPRLVSYSNSSGSPEDPFSLVWLSLPHFVYNSNSSLTSCLDWVIDISWGGNNRRIIKK